MKLSIIIVAYGIFSYLLGILTERYGDKIFKHQKEASRVSENEAKEETFPIPKWIVDEHGEKKINLKYLDALVKKI